MWVVGGVNVLVVLLISCFGESDCCGKCGRLIYGGILMTILIIANCILIGYYGSLIGSYAGYRGEEFTWV